MVGPGNKKTWAERVRGREKAGMAFDKSETAMGSALSLVVLTGLAALVGGAAVGTVLST